MNYLKKSLQILSAVLPFFIISCISPLDSELNNETYSGKTVLVTGSIAPQLQGAFPKEIIDGLTNSENVVAKTAYPSIESGATFLYRIIAYKYDDSGNITGQSETFNLTGTSGTSDRNLSYSIPLKFGKWKLRACVYYSADTNYANPIMQGEAPTPIEIKEDTPGTIVAEQIVVQPVMTSGEVKNGKVNLQILVDNTGYEGQEKIASLKLNVWLDGESLYTNRNIGYEGGLSNNPLIFNLTSSSFSNLKSGSYVFEFSFYNNKYSNPDLVYQCTETVNIYDNLETNAWCGNAEYFDNSGDSTVFKVTNACRKNFAKSIYYVKAPENGIVNDSDTETGNGSATNPYHSIKSAITKIKSFGAGNYTIFLAGDNSNNMKIVKPTNSVTNGYIYITNNINLTIIGTNSSFTPLTGNDKVEITVVQNSAGEPYADNESSELCFMNTNGNLTLKNIKLNNFGSNSVSNRNALYLYGISTSILSFNATNCEFVNCKSYNSNIGAVYCQYCNAIFKDCVFDTCVASSNNNNNGYGGALYLHNSTCHISNTTFKKCSANKGGAIYATNNSVLEINDCILGDVTIEEANDVDSNIYGNKAKDGILYVYNSDCKIYGKTVFCGNYSNVSILNFYIGNETKTLTIGDAETASSLSPVFMYNKIFSTGSETSLGMIYAKGKCNFNFNAGIIKNNEVKNTSTSQIRCCSGIYLICNDGSNVNLNGGIIKNNTAKASANSQNKAFLAGGVLHENLATCNLGKVVIEDNKIEYASSSINCDIGIKNQEGYRIAFTNDYLGSKKMNVIALQDTSGDYEICTNSLIDTSVEKNKKNCGYFDSSVSDYYFDTVNGKLVQRENSGQIDITKVTDYNSIPDLVYIYDQKGLEKIKEFVEAGNGFSGKTVILNNDITVVGLKQIGNDSKYFQGTFEGNDKTIIINSVENSTKALFGHLRGLVKELTLKGDFTVNDSYSCFAESINRVGNPQYVFQKCKNKCNVSTTADNAQIAGICGGIGAGNVIEDCINEGNLTSTNGSVYGITGGSSSGEGAGKCVNRCKNTGNLTGKNVGGITGRLASKIINCSNTGTLKGEYVGGIAQQYVTMANRLPESIGDTNGSGLLNCYNNGDIICTASDGYAGGIVGYTYYTIYTTEYINIQNCVNYKEIIKENTSLDCDIGGIIGRTYSYSDNDAAYSNLRFNYYINTNERAIGNTNVISEKVDEINNYKLIPFNNNGNFDYTYVLEDECPPGWSIQAPGILQTNLLSIALGYGYNYFLTNHEESIMSIYKTWAPSGYPVFFYN